MAKRRVLVTGAAGTISGQLLPAFRERYDWCCSTATIATASAAPT